MVAYAITRAENDPRYAAVEQWEPAFPGAGQSLPDDRAGITYESDLDADRPTSMPMWTIIPLAGPTVGLQGPEDVDQNDPGQMMRTRVCFRSR